MKQRLTGALALAILWAGLLPAAAADKPMSIQVRQGDLRSTPSFLGRVTASVQYGTQVHVREEKGAWSRVETLEGDTGGWIHTSALTTRKLELQTGDRQADVAASSGELALAGKGFNSQVEQEFKEQNKVDYTWVDKMETFKVTIQESQSFLQAGALEPSAEGGAR